MGGYPDEEEDWRDRDPGAWERPPWEEEAEPDQPPWIGGGALRRGGAGLGRTQPPSPVPSAAAGTGPEADLLRALAEAEDALSRLDAGALAAPAAVREGLAARLAFHEAAGWLAHVEAWVHPLDLALRDLGLTGSVLAAALGGRLRAALPVTTAGGAATEAATATGWDATEPDTLPEDRAVGLSLALARALRRLATATTWRPLAGPGTAAAAFAPLGGGAGGLCEDRFAAWKAAWQAEAERWPALLAALAAAGRWGGVAGTDRGRSEGAGVPLAGLQAGFAAAAVTAAGRLRAVPLPFWAAIPTRPAHRWRDRPGFDPAPQAAAALRQVAEAARGGLRELDRLLSAAAAGTRLAEGLDRRSRLPDAVEAALRIPALTPGALARRLKVVPQTATDLLGRLAAAGVVRERTGRRSFRAFAV